MFVKMPHQGSWHPVSDYLSHSEVVWDEELQQVDGERDTQLECKHAMFKAPILYNSTVQGVFHELSSQVLWDDEFRHEQQEAEFDKCLDVDNTITVDLRIRDLPTHSSDMDPADNVSTYMPLADVVWDQESHHDSKSHGLLLQLSSGEEYLDEETMCKLPLVASDACQLCHKMPQLDTVWDVELLHDINGQDALVQQYAQLGECLIVDNTARVDLLTSGLPPHDSDNFLTEFDKHSANKLFNNLQHEVVWDEEMPSDLDTHESMLQELSLSVDDQKTKHTVNLNASAMLTPVSTSIILKQCINAADQVFDEFPSKVVVWDDELFHELDSHDGLLQQLSLGGECWNGEKMICIPISPGNQWPDPSIDFESMTQDKQDIAAQTDNVETILTDVDHVKHELGAISCHVSACALSETVVLEIRQETIDACKFLPEMSYQEDTQQQIEQVVWHEILTAIDVHHGLLQHLAQSGDYFGEEKKVVTSQGDSHIMFPCMHMVWDDDLLGGQEYLLQGESKTAVMSRICANLDKQGLDGLSRCKKLQFILTIMGRLMNHITVLHRLPDDEQVIVSITLHANDSSQYLDFGVVLHSAGGVVGLLSIEYTNHLYMGHLYCIGYEACSRHEIRFDCNHLVIFDEEQGIYGAQYVIDEKHPWRRSAFNQGNDYMTIAACSVFPQIPSWSPNNFSPWSLAWFSVAVLQKFQHSDHSNHRITAVTKYDHESMLGSGCLNVPWDPGGDQDCFIPAIAWGQAMFCGGGIVIPGTLGHMGCDIIDFGPCGGLAILSGNHKGKRQNTEKHQKIFQKQV